MTRKQARAEAHRRWGTDGHANGDRFGTVRLRRRGQPLRYEVGYFIRKSRFEFEPVNMGAGDTWEDAFMEAGLPVKGSKFDLRKP